MNAGDFFWGNPTPIGGDHPWVLLNTPRLHGNRAVLLNFTDSRGRQVPHAVPIGFHRIITKPSLPSYGDMVVWSSDQLESALKIGRMRLAPPPLAADRLALLVQQAKIFGFVAREIKKLI